MTSGISQQQLLEYSEAFSLYDIDDSGTIAVQQLDLVLRTLGCVLPASRIAEVQRRKAEEGEAALSFEEFLYLVGPEATTTQQFDDDAAAARAQNLRRALGVFDVAGTGIVSVGDLKRALREALKDHELDELLRKVDPQQTGKVDVARLSELLVGA